MKGVVVLKCSRMKLRFHVLGVVRRLVSLTMVRPFLVHIVYIISSDSFLMNLGEMLNAVFSSFFRPTDESKALF